MNVSRIVVIILLFVASIAFFAEGMENHQTICPNYLVGVFFVSIACALLVGVCY